MLEKRTKIFILIFLTLVLLALLIPPGITRNDPLKTATLNGKLPIRKVDVILAQNQHDQLFEQLHKFADAHAFKIRIAPTAAHEGRFLVLMRRKDVRVDGLDSLDPGLFEIWVYNTDDEDPVPMHIFDELTADLKELIGEIPNNTFTVKEE